MLGPALAHLFVELDNRKDGLTEYETAIHRELLEAMYIARHPGQVGTSGSEYRGVAGVGGIPDIFGSDSVRKTEIDLGGGGWKGDRRLQTACKAPNCPNKIR